MQPDNVATRWTAAQAWRWYQARPWPLGFNYLPRTAVNFVEMWWGATFDPATIDEELGWAQEVGFNSLRTNLPFVVWQADRDGLLGRLDRFLTIAASHGLSVMLCPLDDCGFAGAEPRCGPQPDPVPGVHNSRAVGSPGRATVMERTRWPEVLDYVEDVVRRLRDDARVLVFDLYNEPGNRMIFTADGESEAAAALEPHSLDLLHAVFARARQVGPSQPLTVGAWHLVPPWQKDVVPYFAHAIDQAALALSDVVSFHCYGSTARLHGVIEQLRALERPMFCTEWMARPVGGTIPAQMPILERQRIGAYQWGLVRGRTQTHLPWPGVQARLPADDAAGAVWFHDLLEPDGRAYRAEEIGHIRRARAG